MLIEGRQIRDEIVKILRAQIANCSPLRLIVVLVGDDPASRKFTELKQKLGEKLGVEVKVEEYEATNSEAELCRVIERLKLDELVAGIVIQLPLPRHINTDNILALIPPEKDVDALSEKAEVLSPVVLAVKEILRRGNIKPIGKKATVIGHGRLVGRPVAVWLAQEGAQVTVADETTANLAALTLPADIIVSGAGVPGLIRPEMIKPGAAVIDAGTSEAGGKLLGDADSRCADKAGIFTPVPGGVGPITLVMLFQNLVKLGMKERREK